MPRIISFLKLAVLVLIISGLSLVTLIQLKSLAAESSELGLIEKKAQALEAEYQTKRIEASKIGNGLLSQKISEMNFEEVKTLSFITAQEPMARVGERGFGVGD